MFHTLRNYLRRIKHDVLAQEVKGRYVKESYKNQSYFVCVLALASILFGILFTYLYTGLYETAFQYANSGTYSVFLPEGKINFYIQIEDFYQSNLRNSRSISFEQLGGRREVESKLTSPLDYIGDKVVYPAGLLSNTYFQDTFKLEGLEINEEDITWSIPGRSIKDSGYTRDEVVPPPLWIPYGEIPQLYKDNRYKNWIYNAPFFSFRKLWRAIEVPASGFYEMVVDSRFKYGTKSVVLAETSWIGTQNYFLSLSMIVVGAIGLGTAYLMYYNFKL